jgi:hypothetical protein
MNEISRTPMSWQIVFDDSIEIMRATVSGALTADGITALQAELVAESARRDIYRSLCDFRDVELGINLSEVYDLPLKLRTLGLMSYHMVALLYTRGSIVEPIFTFFDDRCYNVGLSQKAFTDLDAACQWLTGVEMATISNPNGFIVS